MTKLVYGALAVVSLLFCVADIATNRPFWAAIAAVSTVIWAVNVLTEPARW